MEVASILKGHALFSHFSIDEINQISGFSVKKRFRKHDPVFAYGEKANSAFMLLQGSVLLQLPAKPEEYRIVISKVAAGDLFGLSSLLGGDHYILEAQCADIADILVIDAKKLRGLLEANSTAGLIIMNEVASTYFNRYIEILNRFQGIVNQIPLTTV